MDGMVEPDRWVLDRDKKTVLSHKSVQRKHWMIPSETGVEMTPLPEDLSRRPPLSSEEAIDICELAFQAETLFKAPQDVEWTMKKDALYVLQSRPITTLSPSETEDKRAWYLSLHRSVENLKALRTTIEETLIPEMAKTAKDLAEQDITVLSDRELAVRSDGAGRLTNTGSTHIGKNLFRMPMGFAFSASTIMMPCGRMILMRS